MAFPENNDEAASRRAELRARVRADSAGSTRPDAERPNQLPPNYGSKVGEALGFRNAVLDEFSTSLTSIRPAGYAQLGTRFSYDHQQNVVNRPRPR